MAGNQPGALYRRAGNFKIVAGHIAMGGAVKAIPADLVFLIIFIRQRIQIGGRRHGGVERGIKDHNLRHPGAEAFAAGADTLYMGQVMQRRQIGQPFDLGDDLFVYQHRFREGCAALHDPVADGADIRQ